MVSYIVKIKGKEEFNMKNNKNFNYCVQPITIAIGSTALTLICSIFSDFGNIYFRNQFGRGELSGSFFIIIFLLLPVLFKDYREYIWTKKGLITLFIALTINLSIGIFCTVNRYNLFGVML